MQKFVKIQIDIEDEIHCSEECEYNDSGEYCQLFGRSTNINERCEECIQQETEKD